MLVASYGLDVPACVCLGCGHSTDEGIPVPFNVGEEGRSLRRKKDEPVASTVLELATERFESRVAASATGEEEDATLEHLQVIPSPSEMHHM